jgi:hypothetical protein
MKGRLEGAFKDYKSDCWIVQFATPDAPRELEGMQDKDLNITVKQYRKHRSNDANAMYWSLLSEFARRMEIGNDEAHNIMLASYGQDEVIDGSLVYMRLPDTEEAERRIKTSATYHLRPTSRVNEQGRMYALIRGSSTYNTEEFSKLLNGLISECNLIGVPTASEKDIELALSNYKPQ